MTEKEYGTLPVDKVFLKCIIPNILSMIFSTLYIMADGIFIGKFIGSDALAAINIAMPILMITFAMADMIAIGSSVKVSMYLGEKNEDKAREVFTASVLIIFIFSAIFGCLSILVANNIDFFIKDNYVLSSNTGDYLRVTGYFATLYIPLFAMDNYLRSCGKAKLSMYINIGASILNILLDYILIAKLGMGIEAAAFSTGISTSIGTLIALAIFIPKKLTLHFVKPNLSLSDLTGILYNGSSDFLGKIAGSIIAIITNSVLLTLGGNIAVAAYSVIMYADSFFRSVLYGVIDSLQAPISYNRGAKSNDRVFSLYSLSLKVSCGFALMFIVLFILFPDKLVGIFSENTNVEMIDMASTALILLVPSYLTTWYNVITSSFFTSIDKPKESLVVMTLSTVLFPLICILTLPHIFGLNGVFLIPFVTQSLTFIACYYYLRKVKNEILENTVTI